MPFREPAGDGAHRGIRPRPRAGRRSGRAHGQSLVEFALVLPIVLLLTLVALDFGRVYLGYINLQNMARIAANFASNNPDAWSTTPDTAAQTQYRNQILADAAATNCTLPADGSGAAVVPTPLFTDTNGDGKLDSVGDTVEVRIGCTFQVITPIISGVLGNSVAVSSSATFPVKSGMSATGVGAGGGSAPGAAFTASGIATGSGTPVGGPAPFAVDLRDSSGGSPTSWTWNVTGSTSPNIADPSDYSGQDPGVVSYATPGTYTVTMTAVNINGSSTATMTITVTAAPSVDFAATPTSINPGQSVTFTDASTPGGTAWAWTFGSGEGTGSGATTTHVYNTPGTYTVSLSVTYPAPTGTLPAVVKTNLITVTAPLCVVPSLTNSTINKEQSKNGRWAAAGFDYHLLTVGPGVANSKSNSWTILSQTITAASSVPCTAAIQVNDH